MDDTPPAEDMTAILDLRSPEKLEQLGQIALDTAAATGPASARPVLEIVHRAYRSIRGPAHPGTLRWGLELAASIRASGDPAAAIALESAVLATRTAQLGATHPQTVEVLDRLVESRLAAADHTAARATAHQGLTARRRALGADHPLTARSELLLAKVLLREGDVVSAAVHAERAHAGVAERFNGTALPDQYDTLIRDLDGLADARAVLTQVGEPRASERELGVLVGLLGERVRGRVAELDGAFAALALALADAASPPPALRSTLPGPSIRDLAVELERRWQNPRPAPVEGSPAQTPVQSAAPARVARPAPRRSPLQLLDPTSWSWWRRPWRSVPSREG